MITTVFSKCTGCGACVQTCPKHCISWQKGDFDFAYPLVDQNTCISCGKCDRACPIDKKTEKLNNQHAYAVVNKNQEVLKHSTSGGGFSLIAEHILKNKGVIYGCSMETGFQVKHIRVENADNLAKLRGSKYVQSDIGDCYKKAELDLKIGKQVLFTGTPCQIAGLYGYLGKNYENLVTVDIVCHGVGSQGYFDKYLSQARKQYGEIDELRFRDKEFAGWAIGGVVVCNGKHKAYYDYNNYYYFYFLRGDIYRESCYSCKYANVNRPGDFTLADFWGVERLNLEIDTADGCSLLLTNNEKAAKLLKAISNAEYREVTIDQAVRMNDQLQHPSVKSTKRKELVEQYRQMSASEIDKEFRKNNRERIIKLRLKAAIPYKLRRKMRKFL